MNTILLPMWVVYERPSDFPDQYVARLWDGMRNASTASYLTADSLEQLRERLPPELYRLPRDPMDDACIVEVWL